MVMKTLTENFKAVVFAKDVLEYVCTNSIYCHFWPIKFPISMETNFKIFKND